MASLQECTNTCGALHLGPLSCLLPPCGQAAIPSQEVPEHMEGTEGSIELSLGSFWASLTLETQNFGPTCLVCHYVLHAFKIRVHFISTWNERKHIFSRVPGSSLHWENPLGEIKIRGAPGPSDMLNGDS